MLQSNARYVLHGGIDEGLIFQSWDVRKSCSWRNKEPCFGNTDKIIQVTPCKEIIEAMKVDFCY